AEAARLAAVPADQAVYAAALSWQGQPAVVIVFPLGSAAGDPARQALVMAEVACAQLAALRY
ncbi:MAG: hypothetical protein ACRD0F_05490, partial [Acidimicrobiales bacterium]